MPFGIPEVDQAFAAMDRMNGENIIDITPVNLALNQHAQSEINRNVDAIGKIKGTITRSMNKLSAASNQDVNSLRKTGGQALAMALESNLADGMLLPPRKDQLTTVATPQINGAPPVGQTGWVCMCNGDYVGVQSVVVHWPLTQEEIDQLGGNLERFTIVSQLFSTRQEAQDFCDGKIPDAFGEFPCTGGGVGGGPIGGGGDEGCKATPPVCPLCLADGESLAQAVIRWGQAGLIPPGLHVIDGPHVAPDGTLFFRLSDGISRNAYPFDKCPPCDETATICPPASGGGNNGGQQPTTPQLPQDACFPPDSTDSDKISLLVQWFPGQLPIIMGPTDGGTLVSVGGNGLTVPDCPAPPPPPQPTQPPCSPITLPDPPKLMEWEFLGSELNCQSLNTLARLIGDVGTKILDWLIGVLDPDAIIAPLDDVPPEGLAYGLWGNLKHWLVILENLLKCAAKSTINVIRSALSYYKSMLSYLGPKGQSWVVGIWIVRTIVRSLEHVRVGTDAVLWLTTDISVEFVGFKKLLDYLSDYVLQMEIPSIGETIEGYVKGTIGEDQARCWIQLRGGNWDNYYKIIRSRRERLGTRELIEFGRRVGWTNEELIAEMRSLGWIDDADLSRSVQMYDELPTISDTLHWLQRNVWDEEYIARYKLDVGFEEKFWPTFGPLLYPKGMRKDFARLHYASHWIQPSPEQMRQFVFRLRPGRVPVDSEFTLDDYERILAEQDYAPLARKWFRDTAYHVPAMGYAKQMFQLGAITADELQAYHQDLGYTDVDSARFVETDKVQRLRLRSQSGHGFSPSAMANAYALRKMPEEEVRFRMQELGYPQEIATDLMRRADIDLMRGIIVRTRTKLYTQIVSQIEDAVKVGVLSSDAAVNSLVTIGWQPGEASAYVAIANANAGISLVKESIARLKRAFLAGEIDAVYVESGMVTLGVVPQRIGQYVSAWMLQQTPGRKRRTAAQIVNDVSLGRLSTSEALVRLHNLGYDEPDQMLFLADAQQKVLTAESKREAANLKAEKAKASEIEKLIKQNESQRRRFISDLKSLEPVPKLQKWLKHKWITKDYFSTRLTVYGYSPAEIDVYEKEAIG